MPEAGNQYGDGNSRESQPVLTDERERKFQGACKAALRRRFRRHSVAGDCGAIHHPVIVSEELTAPALTRRGRSCTIEMRFTPTSTGTQIGSLSISDQWAGSPDVVTLSGSGIQ